MSKLFETTIIRLALIVLNLRLDSVTDCMKEQYLAPACPSVNSRFGALQPGGNDRDGVSSQCENHLTVKPQIAKTRRWELLNLRHTKHLENLKMKTKFMYEK
ncbi:hypothetical protein HELRODRAFT_162940 [Helobdella robusta]|uniref:Uncharacterized protein n=1 Tax=Helobdella robusta TaxID=6412 RepID=T1ETE2_HELRO|nr:hypothetical protein HELRODRAFT_162940 [Helobdella robusta]ESN99393.1 hypothetical protein HELRODRAFT_162940 [Helobdella robusta]